MAESSLDGSVLAGFAFLIVVVTLLPLSRNQVWWVRSWDFPRMQIALAALVLTIVSALQLDPASPLDWTVLIAAAVCLVYQAARILPYTVIFSPEVKPALKPDAVPRLRVMSANVLISNRHAERLLALVQREQPDVLVTLESDKHWEKNLDTLLAEYPHTIKHPLDNAYGMHVYSKLPLEDSRVEFLVEPEVPSMHATVVLGSGDRISAHFLHPAPPSPTENERSAERDAELVILAQRVAGEQIPVIVAGDLNDVAWSRTTRLFRKLSRLLDPRVGRGFFNTFHARWFFARWPLDHFFHSDDFTLVELRRLPSIGSDHFPILIDLALEPRRTPEQKAPKADTDDHEEARDKLEQVEGGR